MAQRGERHSAALVSGDLQAAFPKLHMLHHSVEFAERHRFLGRASEAQIESFHASFNALFHKQHRNQSSNTAERLRRCLADASLRAVQPSSPPASTSSTSFLTLIQHNHALARPITVTASFSIHDNP